MDLVAALRAHHAVLLPTDTVYGLAALPDAEGAEAVYRLKGREQRQPTALLAASVADLRTCLPELPEGLETILPGPYTLVVPNPAGRFRWLTGGTPEKVGVRVPHLPEPARAAVHAVGAVVATSANDPGGPDPLTIADVPRRIREGCAAELDAGPLRGVPSTVLDLTGPEPIVLREGAVPSAEALSTITAWLSRSRRSSN
jgi:L-threonylcarbamoyladenylate synthase